MAVQIEPSDSYPTFESTAAGINAVLKINSRVRRLILDYSLATAFVASIYPFPWILEIKLLVLVILNLKMIRDIGAEWGYPQGHSLLAIFFGLFGVIGAFAMMLVVYITVYSLSLLFAPLVRHWASAAAFFTLTRALGSVSNEFYLSAKRIEPKYLRRAGQKFARSEHHRQL